MSSSSARVAAVAFVAAWSAAACENLTQPRTADGVGSAGSPQQSPGPPQQFPQQQFPQQQFPPQPLPQQPFPQQQLPQQWPQPTQAWPGPTATAPAPNACQGLAAASCAGPACRMSKVFCYERKRGCTYERPLTCMGAGVAGPPAVVCSVDPATGDPCQSLEGEGIPGGGGCGAADQQVLAQGQSLLGCP